MTVSHILAYPCAKPIEAEERGDIRQHWTPLFEAYNVNTVFEHDDHEYKRTRRLRDGEPDPDGGILYLGDGVWGFEQSILTVIRSIGSMAMALRCRNFCVIPCQSIYVGRSGSIGSFSYLKMRGSAL
ncbi:hypothetical protein [Halostagnicola bangensis]